MTDLPPESPLPLGYQPPQQGALPERGDHWYPLPVAISVFPAGAIIMVVLLAIVPHVRVMLLAMKMELPLSTQCMLMLSHWSADDFGWVFEVFLILMAPLAVGILRHGRAMTPRSKNWTRRIVTLLTIAFLAAAIIILYLPLLDMLEKMTNLQH